MIGVHHGIQIHVMCVSVIVKKFVYIFFFSFFKHQETERLSLYKFKQLNFDFTQIPRNRTLRFAKKHLSNDTYTSIERRGLESTN